MQLPSPDAALARENLEELAGSMWASFRSGEHNPCRIGLPLTVCRCQKAAASIQANNGKEGIHVLPACSASL